MSAEKPTVSFDHHSREFAADPWSVFRDLRGRCPVAYSDTYGGFWVLTRYEDIRAVALDDHLFSSARNGIIIPPKKNVGQVSIPIELDPPAFYEYRRIMNPMFSPRAIERLEPVIESFVRRCIDVFIEKGECDIVHDLADPVPAMVTLYKLGLPVEEWSRFSGPLHHTVFLRQDNPIRASALTGVAAIRQTLVDAIADRRAHPRDDMITYLTQATVDGRPTTDDEVLGMVELTIQGGFDTTGSAISNALIYLDRDPQARRWLIDDRARIPTAVEEFLRYEAPQMCLARTATKDVEIGGQAIKEGERLLLVWASGNRDEEAFERSEDVALDREPNRHMTFGLGAHRCLGSTVARTMIHIALREVLHRLPDYRIDRDRVVKAETVGVVYGKFSVPATFTPGRRYAF
jgi:cytochrome P450